MASFQLSGLASGFDWKTLVDQLIAVERTPQNRLRTEKTANTTKLSAFASLRTRLDSLKDSAKALTTDSLFSKRTVSTADPDVKWTAAAADSAAAGEYTFNVTKLATRSTRTGAADASGSLHTSNDVSGVLVSDLRLAIPISAGTFTVNGQSVQVDETDTLQDVFDKISTATSGAVTGAYDSGTDRVTLSSGGAITLGGGGDTSNFLYAVKLYNNGGNSISSASALGTLALDETITSSGLRNSITAVDGSGAGSFVVNGVTINFNVNTDSVRSVMKRVNESAAGATMAYDAVNDRFTLTNKNAGNLGVTVSESAGGFLDAVALNSSATVQFGDNAEFSVNNGGTIVAGSNVLDSTMHGVAGLTVTVNSLGEQTFTIGSDTKKLDEGIRAFVKAYNDLQTFVDDQTKVSVSSDGKVTAGLMANNREFTDIARRLRNEVFGEVGGLTGSIRRLESLGIDFSNTSTQLAVRDEAKLATALTNNLAEVSALFSTATTGISSRLDSYVTQITNTGGLLDTQKISLDKQNAALDRQIADIDRRLEAERTRLESNFIRMEEAQSLIQSQLAALQNTLGLS